MKAVKQVANDDVVSPLPAPRLSDVIDVRVYALGAAKHAIASSDIALILRDLRRSCSVSAQHNFKVERFGSEFRDWNVVSDGTQSHFKASSNVIEWKIRLYAAGPFHTGKRRTSSRRMFTRDDKASMLSASKKNFKPFPVLV